MYARNPSPTTLTPHTPRTTSTPWTPVHSNRYGIQGTNTTPSPGSGAPLQTLIVEDGFSMIARSELYRKNESDPLRRAPQYEGLHNLSPAVISRTLHPPPISSPLSQHRAHIWDTALQATNSALSTIPIGSHITICGNSGPSNAEFEKLPPWNKVRGAAYGILYVAEFRAQEDIHANWIQIAAPIKHDEGRLIAGLRILPLVIGRKDLTFHVTNLTNHNVDEESFNLVRDHPELEWGCVINEYRPTNLGCTFCHGGRFEGEKEIFRGSFAADGDLYGWDEGVLATRKPVVLMSEVRPEGRFMYWRPEERFEWGVYWYRVVKGELVGGFRDVTTRRDLVEWDREV